MRHLLRFRDGSADTLCADIMAGKQQPSLDEMHSMHGFVRDCCKFDARERPSAAELAKQLSTACARNAFVNSFVRTPPAVRRAEGGER